MEQLTKPSATPCEALVLFGSAGAMAHDKLWPALWRTWRRGSLPQGFGILAVDRVPKAEFNKMLRDAIVVADSSATDDAVKRFQDTLQIGYIEGDLESPLRSNNVYQQIRDLLSIHVKVERPENASICYYCSVPPRLYETISQHLLDPQHPLIVGSHGQSASRIIFEKPFGLDYGHAWGLADFLRDSFADEQIVRVDHYLYKPTVDRILAVRSALGDMWHRTHIDQVQITVAEDDDVRHRAEFYREVGAFRDMVQNHLLQLLCLVAMELPEQPEIVASHSARQEVMERVGRFRTRSKPNAPWAVRGQYEGYRQDVGDPSNQAETFVALALQVATDRWRPRRYAVATGAWYSSPTVPFYLRTGKAMSQQVATVTVAFRNGDHLMFRIQPDPQVVVRADDDSRLRRLLVGAGLAVPEGDRNSSPLRTGRPADVDQAYDMILEECISGTLSRQVTAAWVSASWGLFEDIRDHWEDSNAQIHTYERGQDGPYEAAANLFPGSRPTATTWFPLSGFPRE